MADEGWTDLAQGYEDISERLEHSWARLLYHKDG